MKTPRYMGRKEDMADIATDAECYYPPPESQGGWRWLREPEEVRAVAGMDPDRLDLVQREQEVLHGGDSWGVVIIRRGYLVREFYTFNVLTTTRFDIWSGTKSFTGTAWGLLLEDSSKDRLPGGQRVELDNPAYGYTWWVNMAGIHWPGLPPDAFALSGYRWNQCYVIPSLDLVVARAGSGPPTADKHALIDGIVAAITA